MSIQSAGRPWGVGKLPGGQDSRGVWKDSEGTEYEGQVCLGGYAAPAGLGAGLSQSVCARTERGCRGLPKFEPLHSEHSCLMELLSQPHGGRGNATEGEVQSGIWRGWEKPAGVAGVQACALIPSQPQFPLVSTTSHWA